MAYTRSEATLVKPRIQEFLDRQDAASLRTVEWYVLNGRKIRERRLTRRFTDFALDFYDLA